jgi:putative ABC transport system permease protein
LVEELGETPENIIGKYYEFWGNEVSVTGVVENIQYTAHRTSEERAGTLFFNTPNSNLAPRDIVVRISKGDWRNIVAQLEKAWQEAVPAFPFDYQMMDERLEQNYKKELADIGTVNAFSIVAIVLSCFGVMGISRYTARKRTKEIAVRKVNGESKKDIMILLNSDFMLLNLIAFVIAIPVVILFINNWLQNFSYQINLSWWVFALAGVCTAIIVFATVSLQSWQAANANPAKVLKSE